MTVKIIIKVTKKYYLLDPAINYLLNAQNRSIEKLWSNVEGI